MDRSALIKAIIDFEQAVSDAETERASKRVEELAPHASVSDLIFYPERDRSTEEIADEAIIRERIWSEGGDEAVERHVVAQLKAVLADAKRPDDCLNKLMATQLLEAYQSD